MAGVERQVVLRPVVVCCGIAGKVGQGAARNRVVRLGNAWQARLGLERNSEDGEGRSSGARNGLAGEAR